MSNLTIYATNFHASDNNDQAFYFGTAEKFEAKRETNITYQFLFVDGSRKQVCFSALMGIQQGNVSEWFGLMNQYIKLNDDRRAAIHWLTYKLPRGCGIQNAIPLSKKVSLFHGNAYDYVVEFVNTEFNMSHQLGHLAKYFDYAEYQFDLQRGHKIDNVVFGNLEYTVTNADSFNIHGI